MADFLFPIILLTIVPIARLSCSGPNRKKQESAITLSCSPSLFLSSYSSFLPALPELFLPVYLPLCFCDCLWLSTSLSFYMLFSLFLFFPLFFAFSFFLVFFFSWYSFLILKQHRYFLLAYNFSLPLSICLPICFFH